MHIDLERTVHEGGRLEARIPATALVHDDRNAPPTDDTLLTARLERVRRGFDFHGAIESGLTLECVRCLEPFHLDLGFEFHLTLVPADKVVDSTTGEHQIQEADCDLYPFIAGKVDLAAVAREQIYLQMPLKPVCEESCRGLCSSCGDNLNRGPCRCAVPARVRVV